MNWRTVRTIRRGCRCGESGQALSELAVSLVMIILPAFAGFLIVAVLCTNGVSNTILARESADRRSNGYTSRAGTNILTWSQGHDNVPFTEDDVRLDGSTTSEDHDLFTRQLVYNEDSDTVRIEERSDLMPHAEEFSNFYQFSSSDFFVRAANLNRGASTSDDPFLQKGLKGNVSKLEPLIQSLFGVENFHIRAEEAYMPARLGTSN